MNTEPRVLLAAVACAAAVYLIVQALVPARHRLDPRLRPYTASARARFGTITPETVTPTTGTSGVWAPTVTAATDRIGRLLRHDDSGVRLMLHHAAMTGWTVEDYHRRQLTYALAGLMVGVGLSLAANLPTATMIVVASLVGFAGYTRVKGRVTGTIETRQLLARAELYSVTQLLAVYLRTGDTPARALERLGTRTAGVIPGELADAAHRIRAGSPAPLVFEQLATDAIEPSAARLYRTLAATWNNGGDPTALLALGLDLRSNRREDLARRMAKRQTVMVLPLVLVISPIMLLFVGAALVGLAFN